ncbi:ABC transporter permease [Saccharopolyspora taberi]|uniref:ABC transporter permease n=1 Tax=Saccharopolyspora taberi TaxID=60895 RepID=A0ABN3V041_9PSEU
MTAPANQRATAKWWPAALLVVVLVGLWELVSGLVDVPEYLFPAPSAIVRAGVDNAELLASASWVTTEELLLGLLLAVVVALLIAVALHFSVLLRRTVLPLLIASQTVPVVVLAPILAIAFGYGILPKLVVVALICFFPLAVGTLDGLRSVDPDLPRLMRTLDASRWAIFRRVEFPSALPQLFSGLRLAVTYAAIGAVFGEWSGSTDGLGFVMLQATPQLRTALVFAAIVVLTAETVALFLFVRLLEKIILRWNRR